MMFDNKTDQVNPEQKIQANPQEITQPDPLLNSQEKKPRLWLTIILIILLLSSWGIAIFFIYQNYELKKQILSQEQSTAPVESEPTLVPEAKTSEWKIAKFGGLFSYEYPTGWHVGEIWEDSQQQYHEITILIDQKPISTAPGDRPRATFEISVINGLPNPDEVFETKKAEFNEDGYSDITSETINSEIGPIYYYKGKIAWEMYNGLPMEKYYVTFMKSKTDKYNQQIVIGTLALQDDPQLSEILRHVILSIKQLN